MWQDYLFLVGGVVFIVSLLPSLFSKDKPNWLTSVTTSFFLFCYVVAYFTLCLKFAAVTTLVTAGIWLVMFVQKVGISKKINDGKKWF